jgi:hypothetical protein
LPLRATGIPRILPTGNGAKRVMSYRVVRGQ